MTSWTTIRAIAAREITVQLRSRAYWGSLGFIVVILLFTAALGVFDTGDSSGSTVGVVGERPALTQSLQTRVAVAAYPDARAAQEAVRAGEIDAAILTDGTVTVLRNLPERLRQVVEDATRTDRLAAELAVAGIPDDRVAGILSPRSLEVTVLDAGAVARLQRTLTVLAAVAVLFVLLMLSGMSVTAGVAEEKSNRIAEILLAKVRPWQMLAGKIVGLGSVALAQILVLAAVGLAAATTGGLLPDPAESLRVVVVALLWFVPGFAFFATMYAVAGALVSRQEDVTQVVMPVNVVQMLALIGPIQALADPDAPTVRILSLLPGFSWATMPVRMTATHVPPAEIAVSYLAMLAATAALLWIGGRVYAGALLSGGGLAELSAALRRRSRPDLPAATRGGVR